MVRSYIYVVGILAEQHSRHFVVQYFLGTLPWLIKSCFDLRPDRTNLDFWMLLLVTAEPKMQQRTPSTAPASPDSPTPSGMQNAIAASTVAQEAELGTNSVCLSKEDITQALISAAESGDLERLCVHDRAVLHGARDERGMTPLLAAVRQGTANTVFHLVTRLGDDRVFANQRTVSGMTCLHLAAERRATVAEADSSADMLNFLFESFWGKEGFPAVDTRDKQGCSALHVACTYGDAEAAKCLLRHGADPTAATENKSTPLHWAAGRGHSKVSLGESIVLTFLYLVGELEVDTPTVREVHCCCFCIVCVLYVFNFSC